MHMGDQTMMHNRRVLGVAAAAVTVTGLLLPTEGASATVPASCTATVTENPGTQTYSLSGPCLLTSTWTVEDGWGINGHGNTITASGISGAVIQSAHGAGGATPPSLKVSHVTIDAAGASAGIKFDGAQGRVNDVTIMGGEDYGVEADNDAGAPFVNPAHVKIDNHTTISGYHKAAIYAHGDLKLDVLRAVIQGPGTISGQHIDGVFMTNGAHGSVKESRIALSDINPASAASFGAGVRVERDSSPDVGRRVEVKRNVFKGTNADFGISVSNEFPIKKLTVDASCNLFRRNDSETSANDPYGDAVARWQDSGKTNLLVSNSTFQGDWRHATRTIGTTTGPPNPIGANNCPPGAPRHLRAHGLSHKIKVTWRRAHAPAWAPLTGYRIKAKTKGHHAIIKRVGPRATRAVLKGLKNNRVFVVTVTAQSNGGKASAKDRTRTG
jgi:Fibronectin type III domain